MGSLKRLRRFLLLIMFPPLVAAGCHRAGTGAKAAGHALIDCAKERVDDLFLAVLGILEDGEPGWREKLDAIGREAGDTALACAVEAAATGLDAARARFQLAPSTGAARARAYEALRDWRYAAP